MQKAQCHTVPFLFGGWASYVHSSKHLSEHLLTSKSQTAWGNKHLEQRIPEAWMSLNLERTHNDSGGALAMHGFLTEYIFGMDCLYCLPQTRVPVYKDMSSGVITAV